MSEQSAERADSVLAGRYHSWSRAIHWSTVALVSGVLFAALFEDIDPHGSGNAAFRWHSFLGLSVYVLTLARLLLWFLYRARANAVAESGARRGLRFAFYALLIALPVSGWWLSTEEGMSTHALPLPALPQWYHSGSPAGVHAADAQDAPLVGQLARLHAGLAAALALVIAAHLLTMLGERGRRTEN